MMNLNVTLSSNYSSEMSKLLICLDLLTERNHDGADDDVSQSLPGV